MTHNFIVSLLESKKDKIAELPKIVLSLNDQELEQINENIRFKIYQKFVEFQTSPKQKVTKYCFSSSDGKNLSLIEKFSSSCQQNQKEFYLTAFEPEYLNTMLLKAELEKKDMLLKAELEKKDMLLKAELENKDAEKVELEKKEEWIFELLSVNIKSEDKFRSTVGNLDDITRNKALKIGTSFKFDESQKSEVKNAINYLKFMHSKHFFVFESDTHALITNILGIAVMFVEDAYLTNEYFIKPTLYIFNTKKELKGKQIVQLHIKI